MPCVEAKAVLREQASLLDLTHDTVFVRDTNDVITYWNRGAEELYGWKREEAIGKVTHDLLHTVFAEPLQEITAALLRTSRWEGELVHTKRDGTRVTVASRWSLQRDETGRPVGTLETNNDITERKGAEEALRRQANLLEQTHDAILVWEFRTDNHFLESRRRRALWLLQGRGDWPFQPRTAPDGAWATRVDLRGGSGACRRVDGRADTDGARWPQDSRRKPACAGARSGWPAPGARNQPGHYRAEARGRGRPQGAGGAGACRTRHHPGRDGGVDRSRSRSAALGRRHQRERLPALPEGTPPNLEEVRDGLQAIARDGRRASDVIARIRALARRTATEKEHLDINEVIREVVALAEAEARRTRARLRTELAADLPRVLGDRVQLQQVVLNLLLNGLDAMHAVVGRPREMVISTQREATDRVRVAVQDSGSGIDPQLASRVFEAFYTTKRSGLGMGLSISRTIVEQHGGRLWVVPNDGPGTTFQFTV